MIHVDKIEGETIAVTTLHPNVVLGSIFSQTNDTPQTIATAETRVAKALDEGKTFKGYDAETGWMVNFRAKMDESMKTETVEIPNMAYLGQPTTVEFQNVPGVLTQLKAFDLNYQQALDAVGGNSEAAINAMAQQMGVTPELVVALLASCPSQETIDVVQEMVDGIGTDKWTYFTFWFSQNKEEQATTYYKIFINHGLEGGVHDSQGETIGESPWIVPVQFDGANVSIGGKIGSVIKGVDVSIPFIGQINDIGVFNQSFNFNQIAWLNGELSNRF